MEKILNEDNFFTMDAARLAANEMFEYWMWYNFYPVRKLAESKNICDATKQLESRLPSRN